MGWSMKIMVVCGAGASSTFVAHRIRRAATARGIDAEVRAGSAAMLRADAGVDVVLLGAHLEASSEALAKRLAGIPVAVLPEAAFTDATGQLALDTAITAIGVRS